MPTSISGTTGVSQVQDNIITSNKIADGTITTNDISLNAITTDRIANGAVTLNKLLQNPFLTFSTAKTFNWNGLTTNTFIDFEDVPTWARRITVLFDGVRSNSSSSRLVQLGTSAGFINTGYLSYWVYAANNVVTGSNSTAGFGLWNGGSNDINYVTMTITNVTGNNWLSTHHGGFWNGGSNFGQAGGGRVTILDVITRIRVIMVNTAEIFTAGTINVVYE